jgi:hypothetical protein
MLNKDRPAFLLNYSSMYISGRQVTHRVNDVIQRACHDIKGKNHGSHIRKSVVSSHQEDPTTAITKDEFASQMMHNVAIADKYYHIHSKSTEKILFLLAEMSY